jgi:hypothetical protein
MSDPADAIVPNDFTLVELVNRVLDRGVVVSGEVLISVAGIDLVFLGLDLYLTSVETAQQHKFIRGRESA